MSSRFPRLVMPFAIFGAALVLGLAGPASAQRDDPVKIYPSDGETAVWAGTAIQVSFDREVDVESVKQAFSIVPATAGTWRTDPRTMSFEPDEPLLPGTRYTARLETTARDARGNPLLAAPLTSAFTTNQDAARPHFSGALPLRFIPLAGDRPLLFEPGYSRVTLDFTLYALDAAGMAARVAAMPAWQWPQPDIPTAGLTAVATWQQHVAQGDPAQRAQLPAGVGAGLYVVDVRSPRITPAQALVLVTDHALVAKSGADGLTLWDSTTPDGQPVGGAAVQALAADGTVVGSAVTDADGLATIDGARGAALVVATRDGVPTVAGLGSAWQSAGWWWWGGRGGDATSTARADRLAGHAHTDRPIYRPGHTVHWKATLRTVAREGYALPAPGQPLTATIRDAGNNLVWRGSLSPDAFGSVDGDLPLDVDAALGRWSLTLTDGTSEVYGGFQVESYVKPDFEVTVTPERPWYVRGETAQVEVAARYYFGQPAAGAEVVLRVFEGWWWRGSGQSPTRELQGTLGPDGTLAFSVALAGNENSSQPMWFEAEVVDASRRPVVSEAQVTVHPAAFALTLESERYGVEAGQDVVLTAATRDHDGQAVPGVEVSVDVIQYRYPGGEVVKETRRVTTGADGTAVLRLVGLEPGWFSLRASASDADGHAVQAYSYAWIFDTRYPWYWWGGLEVDLDHDTYAPGETARLLIKSPVTTTALVTIERDEVYDEFVVPVSGATPVEIPIRPEYAPNATVRVALWQPNVDAYRTIKSSLLTAERTLVVPAEDKRLRVTVAPDAAAHAPRDEASWTVRVTDDQGNPVRAQLSLAVVDKSVLALASDTSGDIFEAFWTSWPGSVSTYDSHRAADGYSGFAEDRAGGPGGGGQPPVASPSPTQEGAPTRDDEASQATPRRDFPDTAFWRADIETGTDGTVVVPMTLPDSLTTWVALARAVDVGARAGQGSGELVVSQPIIADLALPRFSVQGDRFAVDVLGRNYADPNAALDGTVELTSPGLVQLDPGTRALDLPFNETVFTRYSVVASTLGVAPVTASLDTPAGRDAIELPLDVAPFTVPDRVVRAGSTDAKAFETLDVPFNAVPDGTRLEVRLSPGAALSVIDGIEELIGYPYGCVEQTMSRMLPNAVVGRLVAELGLDAPEVTDDLPAYMTIGLQKLYGFQNADGGWGWWSGDPQVYLTAYVMHGLVLSKAAGFDVDQAALDRGAAWLVAHVAEEKDARMQAYAAYVLALDGRPDDGRSTALFAAAGTLDASALAALAMALDRAGNDALAGQALDRLVAMADVGPTTAFWPMRVKDGWEPYHWRSMATDEKNTALALDALTTLRPGDPLAPKAARWLLEHRYGAGWRTTQGTAFAILGLTDYLLTSGELDAEFDWTVRLDERRVASGSVDRSNITTRIPPVVIEGINLPAGSHQLVIEKAGRGTLFYSAIADLARYYDGFAPASAAGYGVTLQREYVPVAGRSDANGWHVGDVLNVRLTLTTREDLWYVIAEDMLPAGLEGLNESLETESGRVPGGERPFWRWWGYERKEVRDDRVSFFATWLPAGTHTFEYAARAVTPGEFSARPATAYAMYRPEVWGRSASDQVLVAADRVASRPALPGDFDRDCRLTAFDASLVAETWSSGRGRDLTGDGLVSIGDIALAAGRGRQGQACGDGVSLVTPTGATVAMGLREEPETAPDAFEIAITLDGADPVGAWEAALALPDGVTVTGIRAGNRLADAMLLPVVTDASGTVHVGGWSQADGTAGEALAILTLQRSGEAGEVSLTGAEVTTADGRGYEVTHDGSVISPPERPLSRVYLPTAAR